MRETIARHLDHDPHFEWRGQSVSRIENLSDIVFALALGMLLLTGAPPQTFSELVHFLISIIPVTASFVILVLIWNAHFVFFRRYALADNTIVVINSILLLMVLFTAYPLRFIFDGLFWYIYGAISGDYTQLLVKEMDLINSARSMAFFGAGYSVIYGLMSEMYAHAARKAEAIGLSTKEILLTRRSVWRFRGEVMIGIIVALSAWLSPLGPFAGFLMVLNWPAAYFVRAWVRDEADAAA
ncbi:MAG: TMEM175 family protein [Hyphomonadaceae bacterium]|nr:TMEM175 family protein [Hyphomonadaceae bacterium]